MAESTDELGDLTGRDPAPAQPLLGTPSAVFQPLLRTRVAIAGCGAVCVGCGLFIGRYPELVIFGSFLAAYGILVLVLAYILGRERLLICPGGVIRIRGREQECCRWDQVSEIVVSVMKGWGVRRIRGTYRRCLLVKRDGSRLELRDLSVGQFGTMLDTLRQSSEPQGIPWKEVVVEPVRFGWRGWVLYGLLGLSVLYFLVRIFFTVKGVLGLMVK